MLLNPGESVVPYLGVQVAVLGVYGRGPQLGVVKVLVITEDGGGTVRLQPQTNSSTSHTQSIMYVRTSQKAECLVFIMIIKQYVSENV